MSILTLRRRGTRALLLAATITFIVIRLSNWFFRTQSGDPKEVPKRSQYWDLLAHAPFHQKAARTPVESDKHRYRPDGLLEVNLAGPHPIYELMARAEKNWNQRLSRASQTLEEAVAEYKNRYQRQPPKGFDLWWKYVEKHKIQLPDEYDSIFEDLQPFYGLSPSDLIKIRDEIEAEPNSYTLGKNETIKEVDILNHLFEKDKHDEFIAGAKELVKIFSTIQEDLPNFRMTVSPLGVPSRMSDYRVKQAALDAITGRAFIERSALPKITVQGWVMGCAPSSSARRRRSISLDNPTPRPKKKTFIHDHIQSMNPCDNPHLFYHHGQFLAQDKPWPQREIIPKFSYSSTALHHDIRLPISPGWEEEPGDDPDFDDKRDRRLLWRGQNSGIPSDEGTRWERSHRHHLVTFANDFEGTVEVLPSNWKTKNNNDFSVHKKAYLNPATMDIAFADSPTSCSKETCQRLVKLYLWRKMPTKKEEGNYKYVLDIDGNGPSNHFRSLLASNSLIFKSTIYPEWFAERIQPWLHYVPIQIDFDDLHDVLLFFRGDGNGEGSHENLGRKIALAGKEWSKSFWRAEDVAAYLFRLTLEYARLMSIDRDAMSYHEEANW